MTLLPNPDLAALINRLTLGTVLLAHSVYLKLFIFTLPGTAEFFTSLGLPAFFAYVVFVIEAIGGLLLILGFHTQKIAALLIPIFMGATWAHWHSGWLFTNPGGGWEYPLVLVFMTLTQVWIGNGHYSITKETSHAN